MGVEHWGDTQPQKVFQFVRVEDIAYDRRPGMQNVVYVVDSGRGATSAGGNAFTSSNGRVWKLVLDKSDPTKVTSFSILIEGDDAPVKAPNEIHQPDNIESTANSLLITEDPGSSQQFPPGSDVPGSPNFDPRRPARIWQYDLATGTKRVAAKVNQSADEGPTDEDAAPRAISARGSRAASSTRRASSARRVPRGRPGGTLVIDEEVRGTLTYQKRDGGQLGLLRIPGAQRLDRLEAGAAASPRPSPPPRRPAAAHDRRELADQLERVARLDQPCELVEPSLEPRPVDRRDVERDDLRVGRRLPGLSRGEELLVRPSRPAARR